MTEKTCIKCERLLSLAAFYFRKDNGKYRPDCRDCRCARSRARWHANHDKCIEVQRAYYQKNRAACLAKQNAYAAANRAREAARARAWRKKHPEKQRALNLAYSMQNREKILAQKSEYNKLKPEIRRHNTRLRKARMRAAAVVDLTREQWLEILAKHNHRCAYCGVGGEMTMDHATPICRGGWHTASNVVPACFSCNVKKNRKTADEFRAAHALDARIIAERGLAA